MVSYPGFGREKLIRLKDKEFSDIVQYMRDEYGINLEKKKVLIECRMSKILERYGLDSFAGYLDMVHQDRSGEMAGEMVNHLTTNYTYFYREADHFERLQDAILPELLGHSVSGTLDIWCAGCSTGEECYTLGMTLEEYKRIRNVTLRARILATDISGKVLDKARDGEYPVKELEGLPPEWRRKYCGDTSGRTFRVDEELKSCVRFQRRNLMEPMPASERFDIILCRNVMIYFDRISRNRLIKNLEDALKKGGYLLIGHAELLTIKETNLEPVYPAVYRKKKE